MHLNELKVKKPQELLDYAESLGIENASGLKKQDIYFSVLKKFAEKNEEIIGEGVLETMQDGFGFLRSADSNYLGNSQYAFKRIKRQETSRTSRLC